MLSVTDPVAKGQASCMETSTLYTFQKVKSKVYNVVLVSSLQQSDSVIDIYFFRFFPLQVIVRY